MSTISTDIFVFFIHVLDRITWEFEGYSVDREMFMITGVLDIKINESLIKTDTNKQSLQVC